MLNVEVFDDNPTSEEEIRSPGAELALAGLRRGRPRAGVMGHGSRQSADGSG